MFIASPPPPIHNTSIPRQLKPQSDNSNEIMMFIGVCGRKGSGKSDIVQFIHEYFISVKTLSYSEPIKQMCKAGYGLSDDQLESNKDIIDERWDKTPRDIMISTSRCMTFCDDDHWINLMRNRIYGLDISGVKFIVLSDIRFQNEADLVQELGGIVINVSKVKEQDPEFAVDDDVTEAYVDRIDSQFYIENDGNIDNLKRQCDRIMFEINKID